MCQWYRWKAFNVAFFSHLILNSAVYYSYSDSLSSVDCCLSTTVPQLQIWILLYSVHNLHRTWSPPLKFSCTVAASQQFTFTSVNVNSSEVSGPLMMLYEECLSVSGLSFSLSILCCKTRQFQSSQMPMGKRKGKKLEIMLRMSILPFLCHN